MKKIVTLSMLMLTLRVCAQQDILVSQYMFNGLFLNPAYAGSHEYVTSTLLHRNQWVNFEGAPKTYMLSVDGALLNKKMGLGMVLTNDKIGSTTQTDIFGIYSYHLKLGPGKLSFGLKGGASYYLFKNDELTVWDTDDEVFSSNQSKWLPKMGSGVYYYDKKWYAGISISTLLAYQVDQSFGPDVNKATFVKRHYYLNGGYVFTLTDKLKLKPSTLLKFEPSAPFQADINLNLLYNEVFWIGASYRTGDAVTFMIEYQTNSRFRVGYAYDLTTSNVRKYTGGSHEILIGYDFVKSSTKIKTPRYF